ncbi:heterokaryon incompatibility protein-domain-containing protein [Suillus occidentalis]|nr:heterokaryon incompatibility protein-domain-containing protein [Suillus occidentalis]
MEAFDLAITFSDRDPITIDLLLLIKAVALFNAGRHNEALRRVQRLAIADQQSDALRCSMVDVYLRVQLAMITFQNEQYSAAADELTASITTITGLFSPAALLEPRWKVFTLLFGWDFDSLWRTVNQRRCDALFRSDRVIEAVTSFEYMMSMIDDNTKSGCLEWSSAFKKDCTARCVAKGEEAIAASNYEMAVELYSAAIRLDSSHGSFFARRSTAYLARKHYAEALADADTVIKLSPSSRNGSELKHAALHGAQHSDKKAKETFENMLSKLKLTNAPDPQMRALRQQYAEAEHAIQGVIDAHMEKAPLRLLNVFTGHLCNQGAQRHDFMESKEYSELLYSSMMHTPLQMKPIKKAVAKYFSWVMLSHRWDKEEPTLHEIQGKVVYELKEVVGIEKVQMFCQKTRDMGYRWAWSDTCCIDQKNPAEVQRSVNSMFVWYRQSALTIVYLSDVSPSIKSGALKNSAWTTRGWTVQEFLAPNVILFYHKDWDLYLDDRSPNHKESATIMKELEHSTGINARALVAFKPGMRGAREKLHWASRRITTVPEDIAYSLFGIFGIQLPVLYGEMKQHAMGRLLQEIVARSGDITALDWVGKPSEFNSCLPAEITSYTTPPHKRSALSAKDMQKSVSKLQKTVAMESALKLYALLDSLSAPRFANSRLHLPCITFAITEVKQKRDEDQGTHFTYRVKADGLQDLSIITEDKLVQFSSTRPTPQAFLLVSPWNRHDFGLPDFANGAQGVKDQEQDDLDSRSRALKLIVRLGQPFNALLLAQQRGSEYKRIASDHNIIAEVKSTTAVHDMMGVKTLEIL